MSRWVTSKPFVGTDDEFQPSPALSKSANTASSSTLSRAIVVLKDGQGSTPGLSSLTLPAARGGLVVLLGRLEVLPRQPSCQPPSSLRQIVENSKIVSLPLTEDTRLVLFWFLRTVFLQGIFACAEHQSKREELEILVADWVAFFNKQPWGMEFISVIGSPSKMVTKAPWGIENRKSEEAMC
ncbi:hypothetical protein BT96DRAFT_1008580 [Gymnopus androsaceus JB14]|uniref:Uncharacterized protein n=1 Tax=Gymnopus androsaceus JB14 TaxID=1447944 RepID=A0A6A4GF42_9AGAR|nr:hypothetical protein BT96DRAFT_1008580 [Gymnopus androsaceus JB14]